MKLHFSTDWLRKKLASEPDEPTGCAVCGAIAGACKDYPNCPGNPEWQPPSGSSNSAGSET
jgi:hypothetical protein